MSNGEVDKADMAAKMAFVESAPVANPGAAAMTTIAFNADEQPLPTYASILSSDQSLAAKGKQVYYVSCQHLLRNFSALRPWSEFFDTTFIGVPGGVTDTVNRLNRNLPYFYANYLVLSLACSSYVLLVNLPFAVFVVIMVMSYLFVRNRSAAIAALAAQGAPQEEQLVYIANHGFTISQLYLMLIIAGVLGFYLTSGSSVVFWLFFTSLGVSVIHAAMRRPPVQDSAFNFV